jgi:hypothetical protein
MTILYIGLSTIRDYFHSYSTIIEVELRSGRVVQRLKVKRNENKYANFFVDEQFVATLHTEYTFVPVLMNVDERLMYLSNCQKQCRDLFTTAGLFSRRWYS